MSILIIIVEISLAFPFHISTSLIEKFMEIYAYLPLTNIDDLMDQSIGENLTSFFTKAQVFRMFTF